VKTPPDRSERIAELVDAALQHEPAERAAFLDQACRETPELRAEVDSLLAFQYQARDFIETPAYESTGAGVVDAIGELRVGQSLGDYKIVSMLAEGGMGEVYLADDTALDRKVAIKLIKAGLSTSSIARHFRNEQRILAGLNHPNIARLYDAAVTSDGLPYFVMEYVEGARIDDCCRDADLSLRERLELFLKVCAAVGFAHRHLIIHRDLKPANIRVTPEGEPKLLDFGIAKLLDPATSTMAEQTITLQALMTPDYASPEQVRGETMTTASDVYSLGIVLYELLAGQRPYRLTSRRPDEIARAITEKAPTRPSTAVARNDGISKSQTPNPKLLRGDLDNIVLKAIRKEPERRYQSVRQFSDDIRRHLDGLPVSARKDTFAYRSTKFVRRHALGVAAAALVLLSMIGGIIATLVQSHRTEQQRLLAERRFKQVRQYAHSLMFDIHDSVQNLQGSTPTRQLIVSRALEYLDSLAQEAGDDASLQQDLATAYKKVGDIQGNPYSANLGDMAGAMRSYQHAQQIYEALLTTSGKKTDVRRDLTALYDRIGEVRLHSSDTKGGLEIFQKSLALRQQLLSEGPDDAPLQREVAVSHMKIGEASQKLGDLKTALAEQRQALNVFESLAARDPQNAKATRDVMITSNKLGYTLYIDGNLDLALQSYRRGFDIAQTLASKNPDNAVAQRDLSISCNNIGRILLKKDDAVGAEKSFKKSLEIAQKLAASDPKNELARSDVSYVLVRLGAAQTAAREFGDALESQRQALAINEALFAANPKHTFTLSEIADGYNDIGDTLEKMSDLPGALENYRRAATTREKMSSADPKDAQYRQSVAESYQTLGRVNATLATQAMDLKQRVAYWKDARSWYARSLEIWRELQSRGALSEADTANVSETQKQVQRCDVALAPAGS
jgi:eukaryotic-like serine/threonine-protein kinase